jgi:ADP-ribose pyrophosphatase YjhB (NUDIX family)
VDCIVFGFDGTELKALLIKRGFEPEVNKWSLMGGFIQQNESADAAATRILNRLTGLDNIYMEQLYCFADVDRDPGGRVVSIAYFALININNYSEQLLREHTARWYSLSGIPELIFDHTKMMQAALAHIRDRAANHPVGFALLPSKFTLPQLQNLYQAIYAAKLDKRNFSRKLLSLGILIKLAEKEKSSSKKGAFYYVFDEENYKRLEHEGIKFI